MHAIDIMTSHVVTASEDTLVGDIADLLLTHGISGVPIVDSDERVVGIVSEGDLIRRVENDTEARSAWWLDLLRSKKERAATFVKAHGMTARDVMTRDVRTVTEDTPLREIADLLEKNRIKRVPVVRGEKLVGIVSRSNLLQGLATKGAADQVSTVADDRAIRETVTRVIAEQTGVDATKVNVIVEGGVVQLWGLVDSMEEAKAAQIAAETTPGVKRVENKLGHVARWVWAD
jgi:CBS domain-containing protein